MGSVWFSQDYLGRHGSEARPVQPPTRTLSKDYALDRIFR